jgi:hypothetical protein
MQHESLKPNHGNRSRTSVQRALWVLPGLFYLAGCGEALNLGADDAAIGGEEEDTCSVGLEDVVATTQEQIEALRGCRELMGSLTVRLDNDAPGSLSLEPLASLEIVRGQLWINGPATSLSGLEALEEVGALELTGLRVPSLAPLQALTRVQGDPTLRVFNGGIYGGTIRVSDCEGLTDLQGLENLTNWRGLSVEDTDTIESLAGVRPPVIMESIVLQSLPQLKTVSALAAVREADYVIINNTGLERLDPLGLNIVSFVDVSQNPALTDLDGLQSLSLVENLRIEDNDALVRIELPDLRDFDAFSILGNDALVTVPFYNADQISLPALAETPGILSVRAQRGVFEVGSNAILSSIILPTGTADIAVVSINRNPSLVSVDMGELERAQTLWLLENPLLSSVAMPNLRSVDLLQIENNPALSVAPFAAVQTFTRQIGNNLDEPAP